ncbi:uncharacterized protein LOC129757710 isoform X1 [Uranotaenia lowii]|uniref:uncharacterized protein LOC129757710 isoform X1 n=1 Tax=Uranotaenia lowii TaxID=190385 RepID=UPI00247A11FA|nr:uncharacterized protein LOC129757710 isoform X1 [Uranotaenia lowii]
MSLDCFTMVSNDVVEFRSTWRTGEKPVLVDSAIGTDPPVPKKDVSVDVLERKDIAIQTETFSRNADTTSDDVKLSNWLKKIYPLVEEELSSGISEVYDINDNYGDPAGKPTIRKHQELLLRKLNPDMDAQPNPVKLNMGAATWLSVLTRDAPLLALACGSHHEAWCEHTYSTVTVFTPKRDTYGSIQWTELCSSPVKACIETLETNPFNKDMFAGGSVSGDIYVWQYETNMKSEQNSIVELFSETADYGRIVDLAWIKFNPMTKDVGLLSCHSDGIITLWKTGKLIGKDKTFHVASASYARKSIILTQILTISNSEFVVGTADGSILLCSMAQLNPIGGSGGVGFSKKNSFAPAITELKSHSFAVTSLLKVENSRQQFLISCDLTGEVYFHDITDAVNSAPTVIIKLPLPFKNRIICTEDMRFIMSPSNDGVLEVFQVDSGLVDVMEESGMRGKPCLIRSSSNGKWLLTGPYDGGFIIYSINKAE